MCLNFGKYGFDKMNEMFQVVYIMGVSGCGKTTIGKQCAEAWNIPFFDGDDFHSTENMTKMSSGISLSDDDRKSWLESINHFARKKSSNNSVVIACSALKEKYREVLSKNISAKWVYLCSDYDVILKRLESRKNHFMDNSLLQSQFDILEPPKNAIVVDVSQTVEDIVKEITEKMKL